MRIFTAIGVVAVILLIGGVFVAASGNYNVAADVRHWPLTEVVLQAVREQSIEAHSDNITAPADLDSQERIAKGARQYAEMCTGCHLAPGMENTEMREGLYPQPPDLAQRKIDSPQEAFWIIKHGIKMTAMPAWGRTHDDGIIWNMVAFLRGLPEMTPAQYRKLTANANPEGHGHPRSDARVHEHS